MTIFTARTCFRTHKYNKSTSHQSSPQLKDCTLAISELKPLGLLPLRTALGCTCPGSRPLARFTVRNCFTTHRHNKSTSHQSSHQLKDCALAISELIPLGLLPLRTALGCTRPGNRPSGQLLAALARITTPWQYSLSGTASQHTNTTNQQAISLPLNPKTAHWLFPN